MTIQHSDQIPSCVRKTVEASQREFILRAQKRAVPPRNIAGRVPILSRSESVFIGPRGSHVDADVFLNAYEELVLERSISTAFNRVALNVFAFSTGSLEETATTMFGIIRRCLRALSRGPKREYKEFEPFLTKAGDPRKMFSPSYQELFLAGSRLCWLSENHFSRLDTGFRSMLEKYVSTMRSTMWPLQMNMRPSMLYVAECDDQSGTCMALGRKHDVSRDLRAKLDSPGDALPVHAALNVVGLARDTWYTVPPLKPFALYPGVRGFYVEYDLSETVDNEELIARMARERTSVVGNKAIKRRFTTRVGLPEQSQETKRFSICQRPLDMAPVQHIAFGDSWDATEKLDFIGPVSFVVPLTDEIRISVRTNHEREKHHRALPGGALVLFKPRTPDVSVQFFASAPRRSSMLFIQPSLLR